MSQEKTIHYPRRAQILLLFGSPKYQKKILPENTSGAVVVKYRGGIVGSIPDFSMNSGKTVIRVIKA